jgi:antitoxin component of RelBE/YafQ-DinJ toxin-antitoxin module
MIRESKESYFGFRIDANSLNRFRALCKARNIDVSVALRNFISACLADGSILDQDLSSDLLIYSTFFIVLENAKAIKRMLPMLKSIGIQFSQVIPDFDHLESEIDDAARKLESEIAFIDELQGLVQSRMSLLKSSDATPKKSGEGS